MYTKLLMTIFILPLSVAPAPASAMCIPAGMICIPEGMISIPMLTIFNQILLEMFYIPEGVMCSKTSKYNLYAHVVMQSKKNVFLK